MKLTLARLSAFLLQSQRYLPVLVMAFTMLGFVLGFNPADTDGGTGH